MAVKNNFIQGMFDNDWYMTFDPTYEAVFGVRNLFLYGRNVDSYCGAHRAFDMAKYHGAPIVTPVNCTVLHGTGWNTFGWTGVFGFIDHKGIWRQFIIGHLNGNPLDFLKVGQNIKAGSVIGYQGASNNLGVTMASHLHIQFQNYEALGEYDFTCKGINAYNIDITTSKPTSGKTPATTNKAPAPKSKGFNRRKGRKTRNKAYARGFVASSNGMGAALRRYSGGAFTNTFGPDLPDGSEIYIFATTNTGWAKVYSPQNKGWVHLDQVNIVETF